mgnify:CR=1 FL=1
MDRQTRRQYLEAMGIQTWQLREAVLPMPAAGIELGTTPTAAPPAEAAATLNNSPAGTEIDNMDWPALEGNIRACTRCELHQTRTQAVPGVGNHQADVMVIGEAPGADEDQQGEPFVGRAGKLLDQMLLAIGLKREAVYISNIVKCRPPNNRDPRPEEAGACEAYLQRQIRLVQPKVILAVGRIAAHNLLKTDQRVGALRGKDWTYTDTQTPVVVTYHPAYLLRSPAEKRKAWQDLLRARQIVNAGA